MLRINEKRPGCGCNLSMVHDVLEHILTCDLPEFIDTWMLLCLAVDNSFDVPTTPSVEPFEGGALSCALGTVDMILDSPEWDYPDLYHAQPCEMCGKAICVDPVDCEMLAAEYVAHVDQEDTT
jgi:hypothetical protein